MNWVATTLAAVIVFAFAGAPRASIAEEKAGDKSNGQWSETAKKGQERAAEVKDDAAATGAKVEGEAKGKADKMKGAAKSHADKAKGSAKAHADKATSA